MSDARSSRAASKSRRASAQSAKQLKTSKDLATLNTEHKDPGHKDPLIHPPRARWKSQRRLQVDRGTATTTGARLPPPRYAGFICHYKMEAGIEARYLRDMTQRLLQGAPIFLDSSELTDLRHLFEYGVERSETLIILATRDQIWALTQHSDLSPPSPLTALLSSPSPVHSPRSSPLPHQPVLGSSPIAGRRGLHAPDLPARDMDGRTRTHTSHSGRGRRTGLLGCRGGALPRRH